MPPAHVTARTAHSASPVCPQCTTGPAHVVLKRPLYGCETVRNGVMCLCVRVTAARVGFPDSRRLYTDMALAPRCVATATAAAAGQRLSLPSQRSSAASAAPAGSSRRRLSRRERRTEPWARTRALARSHVRERGAACRSPDAIADGRGARRGGAAVRAYQKAALADRELRGERGSPPVQESTFSRAAGTAKTQGESKVGDRAHPHSRGRFWYESEQPNDCERVPPMICGPKSSKM